MSMSGMIGRHKRRERRRELDKAETLGVHGVPTLVSLPVALLVSGVIRIDGVGSWPALVSGAEEHWRRQWPGGGGYHRILEELEVCADAPLPGFLIGLAVKPDALLLQRVRVCSDPGFALGFVGRVQRDIYLSGRGLVRRRKHLLTTALLVDDDRIPSIQLNADAPLIPPEGAPIEYCVDTLSRLHLDIPC